MWAASVVACMVACSASPTVIVAHTDVYSIALDDTTVYWSGSDGVYSAPKDGDEVTPTKLAAFGADAGVIPGIAVDDTDVYFVEPGSCVMGAVDGAVMKVPLSGGGPTMVAA